VEVTCLFLWIFLFAILEHEGYDNKNARKYGARHISCWNQMKDMTLTLEKRCKVGYGRSLEAKE